MVLVFAQVWRGRVRIEGWPQSHLWTLDRVPSMGDSKEKTLKLA